MNKSFQANIDSLGEALRELPCHVASQLCPNHIGEISSLITDFRIGYYSRKTKKQLRKTSGYAAAQQFGRLQRCNHELKNWLGRVLRNIERNSVNKELSPEFLQLIATANKLLLQERHTKHKVYSLHELDVQRIGKGKEVKRYEFGNKASMVITNKWNWILNVEHCPDNPYDGHTLSLSIAGTEALTQVAISEVNVDKGYHGHDYDGSAVVRISGSSNRGLSASERKQKRRRSAVEPVIGHMKNDHRLRRCMLRGGLGDALNLIGSANGFNIQKILRLLASRILSRALLVWCTAERFFRVPLCYGGCHARAGNSKINN